MKPKDSSYTAILISFILLIASCKDFIQIDPPIDQITGKTVFMNDETATTAITGIYSRMMSTSGFASGNSSSITFFAGRSADDFINYNFSEDKKQFSDNNLQPTNIFMTQFLWQEPYEIIYATNALLENLQASDQLSNQVKRQLSGESRFIRAFCYFYLTNLFGEVPLILTTDYKSNSVAPSAATNDIYTQIIKDLSESKAELPENYPAPERIRANKWAASALLSRVYLYQRDWEKAENESSEIISRNSTYKILDDLNQVFLKSSQEAILQFPLSAALTRNTNEGFRFILSAAPGISTEVVLSSDLVSAFEPGDRRRTSWVGTFSSGTSSWQYPYKYKIRTGNTVVNEYSMVLRLAEQYLIRAEARINLGKTELGITDLNVIRTRSRAQPSALIPMPLPDLSGLLTKQEALLAVEQERRIELFSEWGHRWLDLKRTGRADAVLSKLKQANWQNTDMLYPIPATEILNNKNLHQNPGY